MQIDFYPLTMDKRNLKLGTEKKIVLRGQFSTRGLHGYLIGLGLECKTVDIKERLTITD